MMQPNQQELQKEMAKLRSAILNYSRATGKTIEEATAKKARSFGFELSNQFSKLAPNKNEVRNERLDALRRGEGLMIHPSVYKAAAAAKGVSLTDAGYRFGKRMKGLKRSKGSLVNFQAFLAQRELNRREAARMFLAASAIFGGKRDKLVTMLEASSRGGRTLGRMEAQRAGTGLSVLLSWGPHSEMSEKAVHGIMRTQGLSAVARAMRATVADIDRYIKGEVKRKPRTRAK